MQLQDRARWYSDPTDADLVDEITRRMLEWESPAQQVQRMMSAAMEAPVDETSPGLTYAEWVRFKNTLVIDQAIDHRGK